MFCSVNSRKVANYILLSFLSFDLVLSAVIETAQILVDDEDGGISIETDDDDINSGDSRILHDDYFRFTTRRRYKWNDWTTPGPKDREDTRQFSSFGAFMLQVILPIVVPGLVFFFLLLLLKRLIEKKCFSNESNSPSSMPSNATTAVHRPPIEGNRTPDPCSAAQIRRELFNEPEPNRSRANNIRVDIPITNPAPESSPQGEIEAEDDFTEKPPDYSTVTLNDLINPAKPAFPVVKKGNETPPPEYGKEILPFK